MNRAMWNLGTNAVIQVRMRQKGVGNRRWRGRKGRRRERRGGITVIITAIRIGSNAAQGARGNEGCMEHKGDIDDPIRGTHAIVDLNSKGGGQCVEVDARPPLCPFPEAPAAS